MTSDHALKQGDTEPVLTATLQRDGSAFDLTTVGNPTVTFRMGSTNNPPQVEASATITDAATGSVQYEWQAGDTDDAGTFLCEFVVTGDGGFESTFPSDGYFIVSVEREVQST